MSDTLQSIHDELLVLQSQAGDSSALNELARRWHPPLWRFARRKTGRDDAASDVMQEAWLAMTRSLHRLHDPATFRAWAYRIVNRSAVNWIRGRQRQRRLQDGVAMNHQPPSSDLASDAAETSDEINLLRRAIAALPEHLRDALILHYLDGLRVAEVARALDIPAGTVKSRLFHARSQLQMALRPSEAASQESGSQLSPPEVTST